MAEVIGVADFEEKVLKAQGPVMVDFFATWCGPCQALGPTIDEIATDMQGRAAVYKVDIDASRELAMKYQVMSVPTIMVFENGEMKKYTLGAQPKAALLELFD